jgi:hypothetical protein
MPLFTTPWNSCALFMEDTLNIPLIFPIKDAASAALMLIKADCLLTAGIINEAEKQYVHSRARTFLDDATLKDAAFLKSYAAYNATI